MKYDEALKLAREVIKYNKPLKLKIVGSIARKQKEIKDIDLITTKTLPYNKKYYNFKYKGVNVDVWKVDNMNIGYFLRTYPKYLLIAIRKGLIKNNSKLTNKLYQDNKEIKNPTIKQIFNLANIKYRPVSYYYQIKKAGKQIKQTKQIKHKYQIQGVIFNNKLWDWKTSKIELKKLGYKLKKGALPRETNDFIRYRINQPNYKKYNYYIKKLGRGIELIIGYPKK